MLVCSCYIHVVVANSIVAVDLASCLLEGREKFIPPVLDAMPNKNWLLLQALQDVNLNSARAKARVDAHFCNESDKG